MFGAMAIPPDISDYHQLLVSSEPRMISLTALYSKLHLHEGHFMHRMLTLFTRECHDKDSKDFVYCKYAWLA